MSRYKKGCVDRIIRVEYGSRAPSATMRESSGAPVKMWSGFVWAGDVVDWTAPYHQRKTVVRSEDRCHKTRDQSDDTIEENSPYIQYPQRHSPVEEKNGRRGLDRHRDAGLLQALGIRSTHALSR